MAGNNPLLDDPTPAPASRSSNPLLSNDNANPLLASPSSSNPLLSAPAPVKKPKPNVPPPPTVETPKGARENPTRELQDYIEPFFAIPNAFLRDKPSLAQDLSGHGDHTNLKRALDMFGSHKLHELSQEYGIAADPQLKWQAAQGDRLSQAELDHPLVRGLVTGAAEFANPGNILLGEGIGQGAKLAGMGFNAARAASPAIDAAAHAGEYAARAAGTAAKNIAYKVPGVKPTVDFAQKAGHVASDFFSRYSAPTRAGGKAYGDATLSVDRRRDSALRKVDKMADEVFGNDLTAEQKRAVVIASYRTPQGKVLVPDAATSVPQPLKGASIAERAALYRKAYNDVAPILRKYNLLKKTKDEVGDAEKGLPDLRTTDTGLYDPRAVFDRQFRPEAIPDANLKLQTVREAGTINGGSKFGSSSINKRGRRSGDTRLLHEMDPGEYTDAFDPAHQFRHDLRDKYAKIEAEIGKRNLERTYGEKGGIPTQVDPVTGKPLAARIPTYFEKHGQIFGRGETGAKNLAKYKTETATAQAHAEAAADPEVQRLVKETGRPIEEIIKARSLDARRAAVSARLSEARTNARRSEGLADYATRRYAQQKGLIGSALLKDVMTRSKNVDRLNDQIATAQATVKQGAGMAQARQFAAMVDERDREIERLGGVMDRVERAASPLGRSAKSGYESIYPLVEALPKKLAAKMRPLVEGAGAAPTAKSLAAARAMLKSANTPEAQALDTALERLATRTTTGKLDDLKDAIGNISAPGVEKGLAAIERANARRGASLDTSLENAIKKSAGIQAALKSTNETEVTAAKQLVQHLKEASSLDANRPIITHNAEVDQYLFEQAQERGARPAHIERFKTVEDAAGNFVRTVRTSGNAQVSKETAGYDFTGDDIKAARAFITEKLGKPVSRKQTLDYLQEAMAFDQSRKSGMAELVDTYGSSKDAVNLLSQAVRERLARVQKTTGQVEGAAQGARPIADVSKKVQSDSAKFDARLAEGVEAIRAAGPGGAAHANTMKRLGAIARAAQEAPAKASEAATRGALESQATSMAAAARAGVDRSADTAIRGVQRVADRELAQLEKASDNIYARRDRLMEPAKDSMYFAQGRAHSAAIRAKMLGEKRDQFDRVGEARDAYDAAYEKARDRIMAALDKEYWNAERAPEGYVLESSLKLGGESQTHKALEQSIADFYSSNPGAEAVLRNPAGAAFFKAVDMIRTLSRAGIVIDPLPHGVNNLGIHFLAEGGTPQDMLKILLGKHKVGPDIEREAERAGAMADSTAPMFGEEAAHAAYTSDAELFAESKAKKGLVGAIAGQVGRTAQRPYLGFNRWLFDNVERNYRLNIYAKARGEGMSPGDAARRVNSAFGRQGDLSESEIALKLNKIFNFYSWSKTVIPYWVKKGMIDPKWWTAPVAGIRANNEAQGYDDPSKPFTATLGKRADGSWRRYKPLMPQSIVEPLAEVGRIPFDAAAGDLAGVGSDLAAPANYMTGHLNTIFQLGKDGLAAIDAARRNAETAPYNTFHVDPQNAGDLPAELRGVAGNLAAKLAAPIEQIKGVVQDPMTAPSLLLGGFSYGTKPALLKQQEAEINRRFSAQIKYNKENGLPVKQWYARRQALIDALHAPAPSTKPGIGPLYRSQ